MLVPQPKEEVPDDGIPNLFTEAEKYPSRDTEINKYSNLTGFNEGKKGLSDRTNSGIQGDAKNAELMREIEKMRKNPRKVIQITVYYDDSTFETFYPGK